jgi:putative ABC transport system substrate-binding protein
VGSADAQQPTLPVIGLLSSRSPEESAHLIRAFHQGLGEAGYSEGRNVRIEYRWAEGRYERLQAYAEELVRLRVAVIATVGGTPSALAAKAATATIPIVFLSGGDVVRLGLVASRNRPEGNLTGVAQFTTELMAKRLEFIRQLVPTIASITVLLNPRNRNAEAELEEVQQAARSLGLTLNVSNASTDPEIDTALGIIVQNRIDAVLVQTDPFFDTRRERFAEFSLRHKVPAIYGQKEYAAAGGLMSYGTSFADTYRQAGNYTGRILSGAKPADLPVVQPTKFELVINHKSASALGIEVPPTLLARADEVIE